MSALKFEIYNHGNLLCFILYIILFSAICLSKEVANTHYTVLERNILIEILKIYNDIIENRKSDSHTLKEKGIIWSKIAEEYNLSRDVTQEVSIILNCNTL